MVRSRCSIPSRGQERASDASQAGAWRLFGLLAVPLTLVAAGCGSSESSSSSPGPSAAAGGAGGGSGGSAGAAGQPQKERTRYEWARLLATGPTIFLYCDEYPGYVTLYYRVAMEPCVDVVANEACSQVACVLTFDTTFGRAPEQIVARTGGLTLTLPEGDRKVSVAGVCGETAEIQVGDQVVTVNAGFPLGKCETALVGPQGEKKTLKFSTGEVPQGASLAAIDLHGGTDVDKNTVCVGSPGEGSLLLREYSFVGFGATCAAAQFETLTVGGATAFASALRIAP